MTQLWVSTQRLVQAARHAQLDRMLDLSDVVQRRAEEHRTFVEASTEASDPLDQLARCLGDQLVVPDEPPWRSELGEQDQRIVDVHEPHRRAMLGPAGLRVCLPHYARELDNLSLYKLPRQTSAPQCEHEEIEAWPTRLIERPRLR